MVSDGSRRLRGAVTHGTVSFVSGGWESIKAPQTAGQHHNLQSVGAECSPLSQEPFGNKAAAPPRVSSVGLCG